jgi:hypothetical protein
MSNKSNYSSEKAVIDFNDGLKAALEIARIAKEIDSRVALCGGLAMHVYGFSRATKDIDLIGDKKLPLKEIRTLSFGGVAYSVEVGGKNIEVDIIIRDDDVKKLYDQALSSSKINKSIGLRVISPEFMVILKYLAGRGKDHIDLMWILREENLVNRELVKTIVKKEMGRHSYWAMRDLDQLFLEADLLSARDRIGK